MYKITKHNEFVQYQEKKKNLRPNQTLRMLTAVQLSLAQNYHEDVLFVGRPVLPIR